MKAHIIPPTPPPDNRTPEEKARDSRRAKKLLAATLGLYAAVDASSQLKQEQEECGRNAGDRNCTN